MDYNKYFDIFAIKLTYLVVFSIVISPLSSIRTLLSELSTFGFPLLRKSKGYTLDSGLTPPRSKKKANFVLRSFTLFPRFWTQRAKYNYLLFAILNCSKKLQNIFERGLKNMK